MHHFFITKPPKNFCSVEHHSKLKKKNFVSFLKEKKIKNFNIKGFLEALEKRQKKFRNFAGPIFFNFLPYFKNYYIYLFSDTYQLDTLIHLQT
jgi:hypothetical protein